MSTLRPVRNDALNKLSAVITGLWGERCARFEAPCATCIAWAAFDMLENVTDGSGLDDEDDFKRVAESFNLIEKT